MPSAEFDRAIEVFNEASVPSGTPPRGCGPNLTCRGREEGGAI